MSHLSQIGTSPHSTRVQKESRCGLEHVFIFHFLFLPSLANWKANINIVVSMRLCCVVTLTVVAVFTLCNGAPRVSEPQKYAPATPPITNRPGARQRWPARFLKSAAAAGFPNVSSLRFGKWFGRGNVPMKNHNDPQSVVDKLFTSLKLQKVIQGRLFESKRFLKWQNKVRETYEDDADGLMLATLSKKLQDDVNGGVDALLANGLKSTKTAQTAQRFENLLLDKMAAGINRGDKNSKKDFVRYATYRGDQREVVVWRMQEMTGNRADSNWLSTLEKELLVDFNTYSERLVEYMSIIGNGATVEKVYQRLSLGQGVENNAFLLLSLQKKAMEINPKEDFAGFIVARMKEVWGHDRRTRSSLVELAKKNLPFDLQSKLVYPMSEALNLPRVVMRTSQRRNAPVRLEMIST